MGLALTVCSAGVVIAADPLPPLRVDPVLLGGSPLKPAPQPVPAPPSAPTAQSASVAQPVPVAETLPPSAARVEPVAPPPAARDLSATAEQLQSQPPLQKRSPELSPPRAAPPVTAALPPKTPAAKVAQNLPPLRVDPALLGGEALAKAPVATETQPPEIGERPVVPALYSAQLAAGNIPHPATTAFSHVDKDAAPTIITARRLSGVNDVESIADGEAVLQRGGDTLSGDKIIYRVAEDEVEAIGNVKLTAPDMAMSGPRLRMRMAESTGEFESPAYAIRREQAPVPEPAMTLTGLPAIDDKGRAIATTGRMISLPPVTGSGVAERIEFRGEDQYHLRNASYSTCQPGNRDWEVYVDELDLDYQAEVGKGRGAVVRFMDVPIFYTPWMNFSLNNAKKSGFLPPSIGSTSKSGFEVVAPWFWNIAPDMDATISPRYMTKRGLQVSTEFRYLMDTPHNRASLQNPMVSGDALPDKGQIRIEYLPDDKQFGDRRYGYSIFHNQTFLLPGHTLTAGLNVNGVSDDNYFSDLSSRIQSVSVANLSKLGSLALAGPWYSAGMTMQSWQTLNDLDKPYRTLPMITASANRYDLPLGMVLNFNASYANYDHPDKLLIKRTAMYPQLSWPLATSAFWVTPKIGLHTAQYSLGGQDRPEAVAYRNVADQQSRSIPVFSVDGGVVFERDAEIFGDSYIQTLEPRAFYTYIPRRDQTKIPVVDSSLMDFNYASMFTENRYSGNDRIGDANQLTLAATSRILDPATGAEVFRALLGTRYYFTDQYDKASLPGEEVRTERKADLLASFAGRIFQDLYGDVAWQYNPRDSRTERFNVGARYRPAPGKIINAGYRYARSWYNVNTQNYGTLDQFDVSAQWPLFGGWHGVGRYNYSLDESRVVETIGGLEYNAGCWVGRVVVQRQATIADKPSTALFFQIELNDFSKIGSNPMNLLRRNIPGYGMVNQPTADPVFGEN